MGPCGPLYPAFSRPSAGCLLGDYWVLADLCAFLFFFLFFPFPWRAVTYGVTGSWRTSVSLFFFLPATRGVTGPWRASLLPFCSALLLAATWSVTGSWRVSVPLFLPGLPAGCYLGRDQVLADLHVPLCPVSWRADTPGLTGSWRTCVPRSFRAPWRAATWGVTGSGWPARPASSGLLTGCYLG